MSKLSLRLTGAALVLSALAACQSGYQSTISPDVQRAAGGAVVGGLIADVLDENVAAGAAIGAAGGAICDDVGVCQKRY